MVILEDLFKLLATGEFSNISLSKNGGDNLEEQDYEKVIGHINLGILEIYKRFKFLQNEITIHVDPSVSVYYLHLDRLALEHNINKTEYLQIPEDSEGCLNIIEIIGAFAEDGTELIMNNRFLTPSILRVANDTLKISKVDVARKIDITYKAFPTKIEFEDDFDPEEVILHIPDTVIDPLLNFIAARVYKPTGSNDSSINSDKSINYEKKYELAMQKIDMYGLEGENADDNPDNFAEKGWV